MRTNSFFQSLHGSKIDHKFDFDNVVFLIKQLFSWKMLLNVNKIRKSKNLTLPQNLISYHLKWLTQKELGFS